MATHAFFGPELFSFLRELKKHNERPWFLANKPRYEHDVRDPMLDFIQAAATPLRAISPRLIADARPVGGSMFRIYRDTRFSKDKTPYKTNASAYFAHSAKNIPAPGFYIQLAPGDVFVGTGLWHPETEVAQRVRRAIAANPRGYLKAIGGAAFKKSFELEGDSLVRPPRGFPAEHPLIEHLKRKDFIASCRFSEKDACAPDFLARFTKACKTAAPFAEFLAGALGVAF
jgi:uncharacterized protein (TIGR02453 family)